MILLSTATSASPAWATLCGPPDGASSELQQVDAEARLAFIDASLRRDAHRASVWTWSWFAVSAGFLAYQVPMIFVGDRVFGTGPGTGSVSSRPSFIVGSVLSAASLGLLIALPVTVRFAPADFTERATFQPEAVCAVLAEAELRLFDDAQNEAFGAKWYWHAMNAGLSAAALLILGLGYQDWLFGAVNALSTMLFGTAQILTQPTRLVNDAEAYRAADLRRADRAGPFMTWAPMSLTRGLGVGIGGQF